MKEQNFKILEEKNYDITEIDFLNQVQNAQNTEENTAKFILKLETFVWKHIINKGERLVMILKKHLLHIHQ